MKKSGKCALPEYVKSAKLNEHFSIESLGSKNNLEEIIEFHCKMVKDRWSAEKVYRYKPKLITSNKKYEFIDIEPQNNNNELSLICNYKIHNISKLNNQHRIQVLTYCEELVKHQIKQYSTLDFSDYTDMPIPPPDKMLATRYDGYLPYLIRLFCIQHMPEYKELEGLEYEKKFHTFNTFIKEKLYERFTFLQDEFYVWCSKEHETSSECSEALDVYIATVLVKRFKANIKKAQLLINSYEEKYFRCEH
ncbi:hypothetical protein Q4557_17115 [Shewanella sp. 5_MG-2023]|uniref:hypothetical protein n=1 Tax=Shewanella sp. 5_MG-2023 TaxID=3062656 RepID=UPI0026E14DCD|nr:hypothetical protein [Shewanella sp. 5_MG-2023]MDO6641678.1 hypothetical protein [Shewanella sp. 5_MG-2023]